MTAKTSTKNAKRNRAAAPAADTCELCGTVLPEATSTRLGHLWSAHRRYTGALALRIGTPLLFVASVGALALAGAPQWAFLLALALCGGVLLAGMLGARTERARAGLRPAPPFGELLQGGGFRFLLIPALLLLLLLLSSRQ